MDTNKAFSGMVPLSTSSYSKCMLAPVHNDQAGRLLACLG